MTSETGRRSTPASVIGPALLALLAAGSLGVLSADGWRWDLHGLGTVAGAQTMWALGAWIVARVASQGLASRGALLGSGFGLAALATYYVYEWLAYDAHAATAQLGDSGAFWVPAAALGGALTGVLGAWAARPSGSGWFDRSALGHLAMSGALVTEAGLVMLDPGALALVGEVRVAGGVLVLAALVLLALAVRRCGARATVRAAGLVALLAPVAAVAFLAVEHRFGYLTM